MAPGTYGMEDELCNAVSGAVFHTAVNLEALFWKCCVSLLKFDLYSAVLVDEIVCVLNLFRHARTSLHRFIGHACWSQMTKPVGVPDKAR